MIPRARRWSKLTSLGWSTHKGWYPAIPGHHTLTKYTHRSSTQTRLRPFHAFIVYRSPPGDRIHGTRYALESRYVERVQRSLISSSAKINRLTTVPTGGYSCLDEAWAAVAQHGPLIPGQRNAGEEGKGARRRTMHAIMASVPQTSPWVLEPQWKNIAGIGTSMQLPEVHSRTESAAGNSLNQVRRPYGLQRTLCKG